MKDFGKVSKLRRIVGWMFLATGVLNLLGIIFNANGAGLGVGIFNSIVGVLLLFPRIKA